MTFLKWLSKPFFYKIAICLAFAVLSKVAFAAAPDIQGGVDVTVEMGNVVNIAEGINSVAQVAVGSVLTGDVSGFKANIVHGDIINNAMGNGSCAQVIIGSVGVPSCVAGGAEGGQP